ncbi:MAG: hypothetical protein IKI46_05020 [Lachnospiraceae bacterium]|nr:hypothetical protein [Lachnospiraceae bacterium]
MEEKKNWTKFLIQALTLTAALMIAVAALVVWVDPFFHYHGPVEGISYILDNERYQNDGIVRNFEYDALITGTSVTENFRTSLADKLFGVTSVKAAYAGGYYKEISDGERNALESNPDIRLVIRSMDTFFAMSEADYRNPEAADPAFLTDDNPFNDDAYVYNADVLFEYVNAELIRTAKGVPGDNFDTYMRFAEDRPLGAAYVLKYLDDAKPAEEFTQLSEEDRQMLLENIRANLTANIEAYPEVEFYYFIPPYCIADWYGNHIVTGDLPAYIEIMEILTEEVLKYDNAHVFCFYDDTDLVTNLDNYSDLQHYSGEVSDMILECMAKGEHELTKETYAEYFRTVEDFYMNYDYSQMYR